MAGPPFLDDPEDTREEIMHATYHALREHGYADLTMSRIAAQFPKSKSLLYHHYDGKDELLLEFLDFMLAGAEERIPDPGDDPAGRLDAMLDHALDPAPSPERLAFESAMVELRAQGVTDERYREAFARHDAFFRGHIAEAVRAGIERGVFDDADPERIANFVHTTVEGVSPRRAAGDADAEDVRAIRAELEAYLDATLASGLSTARLEDN